MTAETDTPIRFVGITICLPSSDVTKDLAFFVDKLGFTTLDRPGLQDSAMVACDGIVVKLTLSAQSAEGEQVVRCIIQVPDILAFYEELRGRKLRVRKPLRVSSMHFMDVQTPSGFQLRFEDIK